jgi:hypothetical protein
MKSAEVTMVTYLFKKAHIIIGNVNLTVADLSG